MDHASRRAYLVLVLPRRLLTITTTDLLIDSPAGAAKHLTAINAVPRSPIVNDVGLCPARCAIQRSTPWIEGR